MRFSRICIEIGIEELNEIRRIPVKRELHLEDGKVIPCWIKYISGQRHGSTIERIPAFSHLRNCERVDLKINDFCLLYLQQNKEYKEKYEDMFHEKYSVVIKVRKD